MVLTRDEKATIDLERHLCDHPSAASAKQTTGGVMAGQQDQYIPQPSGFPVQVANKSMQHNELPEPDCP